MHLGWLLCGVYAYGATQAAPAMHLGGGFGRTGTKSLQQALEIIGFAPCHHMTEVFENLEQIDFWLCAWQGGIKNWDDVLGAYEAGVDVPVPDVPFPHQNRRDEMQKRIQEAKMIARLTAVAGVGAAFIIIGLLLKKARNYKV